jgi:hypothetical protein
VVTEVVIEAGEIEVVEVFRVIEEVVATEEVVVVEEEVDIKIITNLEETTINKTISKTNKINMDSNNLCKVVNNSMEETSSHRINFNNNKTIMFLFINRYVVFKISASPEMADHALEFVPPKIIRQVKTTQINRTSNKSTALVKTITKIIIAKLPTIISRTTLDKTNNFKVVITITIDQRRIIIAKVGLLGVALEVCADTSIPSQGQKTKRMGLS